MKCRKPVTDTVLKALGAEWHPDCFCCTVSISRLLVSFPPSVIRLFSPSLQLPFKSFSCLAMLTQFIRNAMACSRMEGISFEVLVTSPYVSSARRGD